ncbi:hypothetical protein [Nocardioides alcanivorans]|uniref:hypothetical protein n=1 Tax=Nocardioides alcanivorans TaxID=2897352 RepID=UPI001F3391E5|nr:hypothetical protein [Nocardioides alcanivorans]
MSTQVVLARGVDVCTEYNVPLAVEDFVPVLLAGAAFWILAGAVRLRVPRAYSVALVGGLLVTLGGLCKALWKILVASNCWDYPVLENLLFPCLAFGFSAVAWASLSLAKGREVGPWPFVLFPLAAGLGAGWMSWSAGEYKNWPLLIAAAVAACVMAISLAVIAFRAGKKSVGYLFVIYTLGTNILPPLAAQPNQSLELQWAEQLTNSAVQLCFLLGALWLRDHLSDKADESSADEQSGVPA